MKAFVWRDPEGNQVATLIIRNDDSGMTLTVLEGAVVHLGARMTELNTMSLYPNEETPAPEGKRAFFIRAAHNWNCAKTDFPKIVSEWLDGTVAWSVDSPANLDQLGD